MSHVAVVQGQDRNEQMFYNILLDNFEEMAPIIYTPTVGWACLNYHKLFRRPRGMYFCKAGELLLARTPAWTASRRHLCA